MTKKKENKFFNKILNPDDRVKIITTHKDADDYNLRVVTSTITKIPKSQLCRML